MAYATLQDVKDNLVHVTLGRDAYPEEARPTEEDVEDWLTEASDGAIDPVVRTIISLPVVDVVALAYLKDMAISWTLSKVYEALENVDMCELHMKRFDRKLRDMLAHPQVLSSSGSPAKPGYSFGSRTEAPFRRDETQW